MRFLGHLDPQTLLDAYCRGVFPMTDPDGRIRWYTADPRGIIPLHGFHIPSSLAQYMRSPAFPFTLRMDSDFERTMRGCMMARAGGTWISEPLIAAYVRLHELGFAHSIETWRGDKLVGGLYGVSLNAAFFGESMFHTERDASKAALVHLVGHLKARGFELLDSQAATPHLQRFGCIEIPGGEYMERLRDALGKTCSFG